MVMEVMDEQSWKAFKPMVFKVLGSVTDVILEFKKALDPIFVTE
jgi:hypothetical protein